MVFPRRFHGDWSREYFVIWLSVLGLVFSGCASVASAPNLAIRADPGVKDLSPERAWADALNQSVNQLGRVDFHGLAKNPVSLYRYIDYIAQTSPEKDPERFPTKRHRLAFYINSYNALAMYGVISHEFPEDFYGFTDRAGFFKFTHFLVGGKEISLYDYENAVIRPLGDPRAHFALNCMVKSCPRLPQTPFHPEDVDAVLDALTREFVNHPRHVQVLETVRLVRLSAIFRFYTEDFVNPQTAPSLIAYINRYRDEPIDETFEIEFSAYDWTVNYQ